MSPDICEAKIISFVNKKQSPCYEMIVSEVGHTSAPFALLLIANLTVKRMHYSR